MSTTKSHDIMAKNLHYYLKKSGMSQKDVCDILDIPTSTFNAWMLAQTYPRPNRIEQLAKFFGIETSDLTHEQKTSERRKTAVAIQNEAIVDVIEALQSDDELFEMIRALSGFGENKRKLVKAYLDALAKDGK